jgi:fructose-1,6-bisphosphatase/inositol monophosphatase family enzyme
LLLVAEAGGTFTDETGSTNQLEARAFVGSNGKVHEDLRAIVVNTMPEHLR